MAQCPKVEMIDLRGVPGYAQFDDLSVCGQADTISVLIYSADPGDIVGFELELALPEGFEYAGWQYTEFGGTSISNADPDPECPGFIIDGFDADSLVVVNIGVATNCNVDKNILNFIDFNYDFKFLDTTYTLHSCGGIYTPELEYNSAIRVPVINLLSNLTPGELEIESITGDYCQTVQISQDGLSSVLDSFTFQVSGLDLSSPLGITSITANGTENVPFTFDVATLIASATIKGDMFVGNNLANPADTRFNTNEIITLEICYESLSCPANADIPFVYNALFGCNDEVCETSSQESYIRIRPTGSSLPSATTSLISNPFVCGADGEVQLTVTNPGTDTDQNKYTDLRIGFETCEAANMGITDVQIGGMSLPDSLYGWIGDDLFVDFSNLAFDPDGTGGMSDYDEDGYYDDLKGGETVTLQVFLGVTCGVDLPKPSSEVCPDNNCSFSQFYVEARSNCGNKFKNFPTGLAGFDIVHGPTFVDNPNEEPILNNAGDTLFMAYNFEKYGDLGNSAANSNPVTKAHTVEFCYNFETKNFNPCNNPEIYLQVYFEGGKEFIYDMEITGAELSTDGGANYTISADVATDVSWTGISDEERLLKIDLGAVDSNICYRYTVEMDSAWCGVPSYWFGAQQVIEKCNDAACGVDGCELVRACQSTTFRGDPEYYGCDCILTGDARDLYRKNYGFTDATRTTKATRDMVSTEDQRRFMPGDTMILDYYHIITDAYSLTLPLTRLALKLYPRGPSNSGASLEDTYLSVKHDTKKLLELSVNKVGVLHANREIIDLSMIEECSGKSFAHDFASFPWGDGASFGNKSNGNVNPDQSDGTYVRLTFDNDCDGTTDGDCLDEFLAYANYEAGDTINVKMEMVVQKNPYREAMLKLGLNPGATTNNVIYNASQIFMEGAGDCTVLLGNDCGINVPWFGACPGEVSTVSNATLNACGGSMEHMFYLDSELPLDGAATWFKDEYRPILNVYDVDAPLLAPMAYCGNAHVVNYVNGDSIVIPITPKEVDNLFCLPVTGYTEDVCGISSGSQGTLIWNPSEAGARGLAVGMLTLDSLKLKHDFCLLCPEVISATDFNLLYDYGYTHGPGDLRAYQCNGTSEVCTVLGLSGGGKWGQIVHGEFLDSLYRFNDRQGPNLLIDDNRPTVQNVTAKLPIDDPSLIASGTPGLSEEIQQVDICNPDPTITAEGVAASIKIPNSVILVDVYADAARTTLFNKTLVSDDGTYKIYQIDIGTTSLAANNTCIPLYIVTTLRYCPNPGEVPANVCVGALSGCAPLEIRTALAAASGCGDTEVCYAYSTGEVGLQAEWFDLPGNQPLCTELTFNMRVKNVKELTLLDLVTTFDLPAGLIVDPTSWQVAYPGGPTSPLNWQSVPEPDQISGNTYTYTDAAVWSIPGGFNIHTVGLEGISAANATADFNKVSFRFKATTDCDKFLSGGQLRTESTAANPCSAGDVTSGKVESQSIIINGAIPEDYAQLIMIVTPDELNHGATNNSFSITAINTSSNPTAEKVITCVTIPDGFTYLDNSINVVNPAGYTITDLQSTVIGNSLELCFTTPQIGVSQSMKIAFEAAIDPTFNCGIADIGVDVKSVVESVVCSTGPNCDVFVQNSINPTASVEIKPPFIARDWKVYSDCASGGDVNLFYEYSIDHNGPDAVNQAYTASFYRDLNDNKVLDPNVDELIGTDTGTFSVNDTETTTISGSIIVPNQSSCPILMDVYYPSTCVCESEAKYFDDIGLRYLADYQEPISMCTGDCIDIEVCDFVKINADSILGATGLVYVPYLNWVAKNCYTFPRDTLPSGVFQNGPPSAFLDYTELTNNSIGDATGSDGLWFHENTGCGQPKGDAWLEAQYSQPVAVDSVFVGSGKLAGWTGNITNASGNDLTLFSSMDGINWTSVMTGIRVPSPQGLIGFALPATSVGQYWRIGTPAFPRTWGTTEFRLEGEGVPFSEESNPVIQTGNTVSICLPADQGLDFPWEITFETGTGPCSKEETIQIWNLDNTEITLGEDLVVCGNECFDLEVEVIGEGTLDNATIVWTPTTGMVDPTSFETEVCSLTTDVTYIAEVTLPGGCIKRDTIQIDHRPTPPLGGPTEVNFCVGYEDAILMTTSGYTEYKWYRLLSGNEIQVGATAVEQFATPAGGTYFVYAYDGIDPCPVEINEFTIVEKSCADYGDLPDGTAGTATDDYQTNIANNGPSHLVIDDLYLGNGVDIEYMDQNDATATGDDNSESDDEDGLTFPTTMDIAQGGVLNIPFSVNNTTGDTAHVEMWIDWNGDGDFNDPGEMVANLDDGTGSFSNYIQVNIPQNVTEEENLGVRIRLSNEDDMTPYGPIASGEVEDYLIRISCKETCLKLFSVSISNN